MTKATISNITNLLQQVKVLQQTRQQMQRQEIARVLSAAAPHIQRVKTMRYKHAQSFNVFSALGVTRKEVIQSRFLANLLDPSEHHCQNSLFLDAFLSKIGLPEVTDEHCKRVKVHTELRAEDGLGRMDIVVDCQPDWLVVIENKIDAGEGEQQLPRYAEWLRDKQNYKLNPKLIFLTPKGHESVTGTIDQYKRFSYLDLAEAFEPLLRKIKAKSVRIVVKQYIDICKLIGGIDVTTQDKQLLALLTDPQNIETVLEIERQARLIRGQVIREFGGHIEKMLQDNLDAAKLTANWKASHEFNGQSLGIVIMTSKHRTKPNYWMFAQHVLTATNGGWSGWFRPQWVDLKSQTLDIKNLSDKMKSNGCKGAENWWVGSKNLRGGKGGFVTDNIEDIMACFNDNRTEDHPLATAMANELWDMFKTYREDIEALESFKQAAA